jgi:hypothetical protein
MLFLLKFSRQPMSFMINRFLENSIICKEKLISIKYNGSLFFFCGKHYVPAFCGTAKYKTVCARVGSQTGWDTYNSG